MKSHQVLLMLLACFLGLNGNSQPMQADFEKSASYRWLNKTVLESRQLDPMESLDHWVAFTTGAQQIVDARSDNKAGDVNQIVTEIMLATDKIQEGNHSLKMQLPTKLNVQAPKSGRGWGTAGVRRAFDHENWETFNRISLWIYPDNPGTNVHWIELRLFNEGEEQLPALFGQEGETSVMLRNHEWNHVVWELSNVARDAVTFFEISYYFAGNEPAESEIATFYLDQLELQKVKPDHIEGWDVWPGRISYSHSGYLNGAVKTAIANGLKTDIFHLINQETGEIALSKRIENVTSHIGTYQIIDFSEVSQTGTYKIRTGDVLTNSFKIGPDVWRESILKTLNFFYSERCGEAIPGIHGICHRDWRCLHGDLQIVVNGGWHDAGDLTQGITHTSEAVYAMFAMAEQLQNRQEDPELYNRLVEEAKWGLDWILKTSFRDGYRFGGSANSRKTNGIIGDYDDVISSARNVPIDHLLAAASEAIAFRVLNKKDPQLAAFALKMAEEDWNFAIEGLDQIQDSENQNVFRGTFDPNNVEHEVASTGILAAIELWKGTKQQTYLQKAYEWAKIIVGSQQREKPDWDIPLMGYFYTGTDKDHILHYVHRGNEQATILALSLLCDLSPDHPDWMSWYSTVVFHSEYMKKISDYTHPYRVMPASIYSDEEYQLAPESRREYFREQVLNGIPLGKGHYLRLFPVWMDYRGHFGVILPQAQALIYAGKLRGDIELANLAQHQAEWIIGRNPFSQSTMYGEGYDFPPLYSVMSGDMVGGLPVGIQTRGNSDVPYWPVQNTWTYKEIWTRPVIRWTWLMKDLSGPAYVLIKANDTCTLENTITGEKFALAVNSYNKPYETTIPQGSYKLTIEDKEFQRTFLPSATYEFDFGSGRILDYALTKTTGKKDEITIRLDITGSGKHTFRIRTENLNTNQPEKTLALQQGKNQVIEWRCRINNPDMPWVAVIIPDNDHSLRKEAFGIPWE